MVIDVYMSKCYFRNEHVAQNRYKIGSVNLASVIYYIEQIYGIVFC